MELRIENLTKTYPGGVRALKDVSLVIPSGMFGLLGPNGAGKSTLMRTIATLQEADEGSIQFNGIDVLREKEEVRKILGYLPQEFGLYPKAEAEALLDHFATLKGISARGERKDVVHALLEQTNLADARKRKVGTFSGGMRQRFGIAVALLGNPKLIIVDEPTAGLDPAERVRFLNLLSEIGENAVVILSTHIVDDVRELCSQMAIIHEGEILREGDPVTEIARLDGRIWRRTVERQELTEVQQEYRVVSSRLLGGRTVVRVLSETLPGPEFESVPAELEDVYFVSLRRLEAASGGVMQPLAEA